MMTRQHYNRSVPQGQYPPYGRWLITSMDLSAYKTHDSNTPGITYITCCAFYSFLDWHSRVLLQRRCILIQLSCQRGSTTLSWLEVTSISLFTRFDAKLFRPFGRSS